MSDLKLEKEEFVSGLGGTTVAEINLITSTLIAGFFLRCCILICIPSSLRQVTSNLPLSFLLEYATIILPGIVTLTILADYAVYILVAELLTSAVLILMKLKTLRHFSFKSLSSALSSPYPHHRHPYITLTRTFINVFTAIAILAVDFPIFPRRLAKTETYGSGLMDLGVGVFLMSHGLTSPEARHHEPPNSRGGGVGLVGYLRLVGRTVRGVLPLFLLGMARLLVVKYTGYQEHVTEYGVHWNFFFTIATVRISCSLLHPLLANLPYGGHGVVSIATCTLYQVMLQWGGLESYLVLGPQGDGSRIGLVSANREGIVSCVGYIALYMGWVELGKWLFKPRKLLRDYLSVLSVLFLLFVSLWLATSVSGHFIQPISRRMVNLTYILWIFSFGAMALSFFLAIDLILLLLMEITHTPHPPPYTTSNSHPPPLCATSAVDYNQLGFFVLANVCTGLVNTCMDTLHAGATRAGIVLGLYMAVLLGLSVAFHMLKIKIKL